MNNVPEGRWRRGVVDVMGALREMNSQLSLLNHHVGLRLALRDVDLDCIDLLARNGSQSPTALARLAGLHPATMTGILDRLERDGWVVRERDQRDRRAVTIVLRPERGGELYRLFGGMRAAVDDICADLDPEQLALIAGFLTQVAAAGGREAEALGQ
ncbi:MarR family transcriptional regulator [Actinophytocola xinjiangensis]|uniref:MarR family transcriptional regulator n=1 Tax=Actinophytocola xinjiangensis TaxID=485602 RepID=A0A7Z0WG15_9PSEU|nr:MarR family transcriptional regulator [Actinophytocola xinjiangensis]OLF06445.1 MarR family transcriptional regulator [Actinophytocola xinjiangensis]